MFYFDPESFFFPAIPDWDDPIFLSTIMSDFSGAQVASSSSSQPVLHTNGDGLLEDPFSTPTSTPFASSSARPQNQIEGHNQLHPSLRQPRYPNPVPEYLMDSSAPFLPSTLLKHHAPGSPASLSSTEEVEMMSRYNMDGESPPSAASTPALLHPSLRYTAARATASPASAEESAGEQEPSEIDEDSEQEVIFAPNKRKRKGGLATHEPPTKRARLQRTTKNLANEKLKIKSDSPPPRRFFASRPVQEVQPPKPIVKPKPRTPTPPKEKPSPSAKPGFPYWGAEHSANPPLFVSTPIERREHGLHTLMDPPAGEKPAYTWIIIIKHAILGCPDKRLTIDGIYEQIMGRFEYYRDKNGKCDKGWKNSVRHQMSLSACFEKKERLVWESGKGVWWTVNESVEGGTKRERKRNPRGKNAKGIKEQGQAESVKITPSPNVASAPKEGQNQNIGHPLFPQIQPVSTGSQEVISRPSQHSPIQTSARPEPTVLARSMPSLSTARPPFRVIPSTSVAAAPGMTTTYPTVQPSFRPVAKPPNVPPLFHSERVSSTRTPLQTRTASILDRETAPSRTFFAGRRDKQAASKGILHTRWQSSGKFQFDATPRENNNQMDSDEDD